MTPKIPWFKHEQVGHGITRIYEPYVHSLLQSNIWHVHGTRDLWIDAGLGIVPLSDSFLHLARAHPLLVLTHAHVDHSGGADAFENVLIHPLEVLQLPSQANMSLAAEVVIDRLELEAESWRDTLPSTLLDNGSPVDGTSVTTGNGPGQHVGHVVEGDQIDIGTHIFTVIELPGHTPGSVGLWSVTDGLLFTGDALYSGKLIDDLPNSDRARYLRSMQRIIELDPRLVLPGHGLPLTGDRAKSIATTYIDTHS